MARIEIPLLRESQSFATRLIAAAKTFRQPRYFFHRRVNWSYRYDEDFYDREASYFLENPDGYISGSCLLEAELADVHLKKLNAKQVGVVLLKVLSHRLFSALGRMANLRIRAERTRIYRKSYVDDIELVFDQNERSVVRAVFPFPINVLRQLRYLGYLRRNGLFFKLDGNPYVFDDIVRFVVRRDVRSLMRLESRAQIRHAQAVMALGICEVQLSDEFDIGSLDFTRYLARYPIRVINSAHGVGKYYPIHCYREFHILTNKQRRYYHAVRECNYVLRHLNDTSAKQEAVRAGGNAMMNECIRLVVLSQRFGEPSGVVADAETELLDYLRLKLGSIAGVKLIYKPHPNRANFDGVSGFVLLSSLSELNGLDGTIYISFFSTCQIDPAFKGRKILIRAKYICPEIAFDESEQILSMSELVQLVRREVAAIGNRQFVCAE